MEGLDGIRDALLGREMRKREKEQQSFENKMKEMAMALRGKEVESNMSDAQQRRSERVEAADERAFERELAPIQTQQKQYDFELGRVDKRMEQALLRKRDLEKQIAEQRNINWDRDKSNPRNVLLAAQADAARERGNVGGYETVDEDGDGNVVNIRRRVPLHGDGMRPPGQPRGAQSPGPTDNIPTLTPQQAANAKPGTKYRTVDGRLMIR